MWTSGTRNNTFCVNYFILANNSDTEFTFGANNYVDILTGSTAIEKSFTGILGSLTATCRPYVDPANQMKADYIAAIHGDTRLKGLWILDQNTSSFRNLANPHNISPTLEADPGLLPVWDGLLNRFITSGG